MAIDCGLPAALSAKLNTAFFAPPDWGVKLTVTVQAAAIASVPPATGHGLFPVLAKIAKFGASFPVIAMPVTVRMVPPTFVSVTICEALVVPTACSPKVSIAGKRFASGAGVTPAPMIGITC